MDHSKIKKEGIIELAVLKQLNVDDLEEFKNHLQECDACRNELLRTKLLFSVADSSSRDSGNGKLTLPFFIAIMAAMLRYTQKHAVTISIVAIVIISAVVMEYQYHFLPSFGKEKTIVANNDVFIPNSYLESIISTSLRSGNEVNVSTPEKDIQFHYDGKNGFPFTIDARIENTKDKDVLLKILSNSETDYLNDSSMYMQNVELAQDAGNTILSLEEQLFLDKGLYYLTLQYKNEIDYIYVARFYVK